MLIKNKELNNMEKIRYTLYVKIPGEGWALAMKTNDIIKMIIKKVELQDNGHKVKLTKEEK
jgi:alkylhydroperoxidase/carboxymuconolactone decarboxylase family protein YurZ